MKHFTLISRLALFLLIIGGLSSYTFAQDEFFEVETTNIQVPLNKSRMIRLPGANRISGGNPKILDVKTFPNSNQILFQGKSLGTTNVVVWNRGQVARVINVEVSHDLENLKVKLHELLPDEHINVRSSQKNIVLSGSVSALDKMQAAVDIAQSYLPTSRRGSRGNNNPNSGSNITINTNNKQRSRNRPKIINLLHVAGAQQVMLEVKVAEIARSLGRLMDIQMSAFSPGKISFGGLSGGGNFLPVPPLLSSGNVIDGPLTSLLLPNTHSIDATGIFLSAISGDFIFNMTIDAAKDQNLAKILAEPTLTTMSGQEATFLSGGEFPIPVPQTTGGANNTITIEFKEFGVSLRFLPVVLDSGRINLNLNVTVSELSNNAPVVANFGGVDSTFIIPSLTVRRASTTLELGDGQTMSIAGLLDEKLRENVNKFPGLGDVPVLGALFRSEQFLREETELVIFVTPKLAVAQTSAPILPTDSFVEPDDIDFYLFGGLEARNADEIVNFDKLIGNKSNRQMGLEGEYGHKLIEE